MSDAIIGYGRTADVVSYDHACVIKLFKPFMDGASIDRCRTAPGFVTGTFTRITLS